MTQAHETALLPAPNVKATTLDEVCDQIQSDDEGKWDIIQPKSALTMHNGKLYLPDCYESRYNGGLTPTLWATSQLCGRLSIPTAYFRRCPVRLQDIQFNYWCNNADSAEEHESSELSLPPASHYPEGEGYSYDEEAVHTANRQSEPAAYRNGNNGHAFHNGRYAGAEKNEYWLLRAKGDTLRAVLTERYCPLDNRALLESLRKSLPPHLQVQWVALDDESLHLRLFDPNLRRDVRSDDPLQAGLHIANSEVGKRSVTVDAVVYREVCSNGLVRLLKGKSILQQRHIGVAPAHFTVLLRQAMQQALYAAHEFTEQMALAAQAPLRDVEAELKHLVSHWHLTQNFVEQVKTSLQREDARYQESVFGLVNAVTHAAQSLDADRRYEMEVVAGKLLERQLLRSSKIAVRTPMHLTALPQTATPLQMAREYFEAEPVEDTEEVVKGPSEAVAA